MIIRAYRQSNRPEQVASHFIALDGVLCHHRFGGRCPSRAKMNAQQERRNDTRAPRWSFNSQHKNRALFALETPGKDISHDLGIFCYIVFKCSFRWKPPAVLAETSQISYVNGYMRKGCLRQLIQTSHARKLTVIYETVWLPIDNNSGILERL
jgi:hypothetical protein